MPRIQIFKAGKHTSSNGVTADYPVSRLEPAILNYNAQLHISPVVAGHPSADDPALAWVKSLHMNGDIVEAEIDEVEPAFAEAVKTGRYKKVSASFFLPDSPSNPMPGQLYLRHVGILGAATPAVTGLKPLNFAAADAGVVEFDDGLQTQMGLFRSIREWIIEKFGAEDADKAVPASEVEWLNTLDKMDAVDQAVEAVTGTDAADSASVAPMFAEGDTAASTQTEQVAADTQNAQGASTGAEQTTGNIDSAAAAQEASQEAGNATAEAVADHSEAQETTAASAQAAQATADFSEREAALAAREAELATKEAALRQAECVNFCDALVTAGQLRPCDSGNAKNILASLYEVQGSIDFAETQVPVAEAFKQFLKNLPQVVEFGEVAAEDTAPTQYIADFVAAPGYEVDPAGEATRKAIAALASKQGISFTEAAARYTQR